MALDTRPVTTWTKIDQLYGDEFIRDETYENWRPNGTNDFLLIYTMAGAGRISWIGGGGAVQTGDLLLYQPNARQDYRTEPDVAHWHLAWVHFKPKADWHQWLDWPTLAPRTRKLHIGAGAVRNAVGASLQRAGRLSRRSGRFVVALAQNALEDALIRAAHLVDPASKRLDPRIEKAVEMLSETASAPSSMGSVAVACGLSVSRLAHLFREQVGIAPARFAEIARLRRAAGLLRMTSMSVAEVADECGYADQFYFSNRFRKEFSTSPTAYRNRKK